MSVREMNVALLSAFPENVQEQIFVYLTENYCTSTPFSPKTADVIYSELEGSRKCIEEGRCEEFDEAVEEIAAKYGL